MAHPKHIAPILLVIAATVLGACNRAPESPPSVTSPGAPPVTEGSQAIAPGKVDGPQARRLVHGGARLIDVRSPEEYAQGHVDGAESVPVDTVAGRELGAKDGAIVLYCHSGRRSSKAASVLRERGYTRVYDLGAMDAWGQASPTTGTSKKSTAPVSSE